MGNFLLGQPLTTLLPAVTACHPVKGERVACLAPQVTVKLDSLQLTGLTLLSYTGLLYGLYLPPCPVAATPILLRWLRAHYGPGQVVGKGQLLWPGPVVTVIYEPVVTWKRVGRSRAASVAQVQGIVGVLSTPLLARAQADQKLEHTIK